MNVMLGIPKVFSAVVVGTRNRLLLQIQTEIFASQTGKCLEEGSGGERKVPWRVNFAFGKFETRGHFPPVSPLCSVVFPSPLSPSLMASFSENNKSSFRFLGLQLLNFERKKSISMGGRGMKKGKTKGQGHI